MTSPRATRSTHERNLERDLEQRRQPVADGHRASPSLMAPEEDVAGRLARQAAEREASRRAHERAG